MSQEQQQEDFDCWSGESTLSSFTLKYSDILKFCQYNFNAKLEKIRFSIQTLVFGNEFHKLRPLILIYQPILSFKILELLVMGHTIFLIFLKIRKKCKLEKKES